MKPIFPAFRSPCHLSGLLLIAGVAGAERALRESKSIKLEGTQKIKLDSGRAASLLVGAKMIGGKTQGYLAVIVNTEKHVYAYESWGPQESYELDYEAITASAKTLRTR